MTRPMNVRRRTQLNTQRPRMYGVQASNKLWYLWNIYLDRKINKCRKLTKSKQTKQIYLRKDFPKTIHRWRLWSKRFIICKIHLFKMNEFVQRRRQDIQKWDDKKKKMIKKFPRLSSTMFGCVMHTLNVWRVSYVEKENCCVSKWSLKISRQYVCT